MDVVGHRSIHGGGQQRKIALAQVASTADHAGQRPKGQGRVGRAAPLGRDGGAALTEREQQVG